MAELIDYGLSLTEQRPDGSRKLTAAISWLAHHLIESLAAYGEAIYPCFVDPGDLINGQKPERDSKRLAEDEESHAVGKSANRPFRFDRPFPVIR